MQRFVFSSSCSNYGAAGDELLDETAAFNPVTPYGDSKVLAEHDLAELADDALLARRSCAAATAYGVSPRLRGDLVVNNLDRLRGRRPARCCSRATARPGGRSSTSRTSPARSSPRSRRRATRCTARRSTSGRPTENYRVRDSRRDRGASSVPGSRIVFGEGAGPDARTYRVDCEKLARDASRRAAALDGSRPGIEELRDAFTARGLTREDARGAALPAHPPRPRAAGRGPPRRAPALARAGHRPCLTSAAACAAAGGSRCSSRSASLPLADALVARGGPRAAGAALPARRRLLPRLRARPDPRGGAAGAAVRRQLPLLLVVLGRAARARAQRTRSGSSRSAGSGPRASSSRSARTTATCCATSPRPACRCSASTRRPTRPSAAERAGVPTVREFFGEELAPAPAARRPSGGRDRRQQRHGAHARPERLRGRPGAAAAPRRRRDDREPVGRGPDRALRVRHRSTTSTSRTSRPRPWPR